MIFGHHPAIIVAHPDDEILWAGGLPLVYGDLVWTIICCSIPRRDPIRAWKFHDACLTLGALPRLLPAPEQDINTAPVGLDAIDLTNYDAIVTHNEWGEYGHHHHASVSAWVRTHYNGPIVTFGYGVVPGVGIHQGEMRIELTPLQLAIKLAALRRYDHILEYQGRDTPKWQALEHRYYETEGIDPKVETYDIHVAE